jgi:hypothetical protein
LIVEDKIARPKAQALPLVPTLAFNITAILLHLPSFTFPLSSLSRPSFTFQMLDIFE